MIRNFEVNDYVIYTLVKDNFVIKGIVVDVNENFNGSISITIEGDNGGAYRDYEYMFELDYLRNREDKLNKILNE